MYYNSLLFLHNTWTWQTDATQRHWPFLCIASCLAFKWMKYKWIKTRKSKNNIQWQFPTRKPECKHISTWLICHILTIIQTASQNFQITNQIAVIWITLIHLKLNWEINDLQHKGAMSTKPVFEKIVKRQRLYVPLCDIRHLCFWYWHLQLLWLLLTKSRYFAMM